MPRTTHLNRALSKMGVLTRSRATAAILDGRVTVNGRVVRDPAAPVVPGRARVALDGVPVAPGAWRTIVLNKPAGVVTTRHDPDGRPTVYSILGSDAEPLVPVGRLDMAMAGLLLLTTDTALAAWLTDPDNAVSRVYVVSARGRVTEDDVRRMERGVTSGGERLRAARVTVRKVSERESHLLVELREGRNREVRRLCEAVGHEVTRLKRVAFGGLEIGDLEPGHWREVTRHEIAQAFPRWRSGQATRR